MAIADHNQVRLRTAQVAALFLFSQQSPSMNSNLSAIFFMEIAGHSWQLLTTTKCPLADSIPCSFASIPDYTAIAAPSPRLAQVLINQHQLLHGERPLLRSIPSQSELLPQLSASADPFRQHVRSRMRLSVRKIEQRQLLLSVKFHIA